MRWTIPFLLLAVPLLAGEDPLAEARADLDAALEAGDALRAKGDVEGAVAAYREAVAAYARALERFEAGRGLRGPAGAGAAVDLALRWLAAHQDADGRFDCDGFVKHDPEADRCDGAGGPHYDVGVTGLALLAFLRAGHDRQRGPFSGNVRAACDFLARSQDADGCIGGRETMHFIYNHAIATLALCEAHALDRDPALAWAAQRAVGFLERARNPYLGWRYGVRSGENDTSVTCWCVQALAAGRRAGLAVDEQCFQGALAWIGKMTDPETARVGYHAPGGPPARPQEMVARFPAERSESLTAAAIAARIAMGEDPSTSAAIRKGAERCLAQPPTWNPRDGSIDMYYWFHGTEALARVGGEAWTAWRTRLDEALLRNQHGAGSGARAGSWDPVDPWGRDGGRVYSTALMALSLATGGRSPAAREGPR